MSSDAAFSPIAFPALPGRGTDERDSIRGHAAGYAAGRKQAEKEVAALRESIRAEAARAAELASAQLRSALDALARAAADLRARQAPVLQSVDASIAAAAIELAEAVVGHELATADGSARAALERASGAEVPVGTVVRVSPQDIALIAAQAGDQPGIELVADDGLQPGDAVVELAHGSIDARVSASLARAKAALAEGSA
jgi:flagellar assembly protein FliH